MTTTAQLSRRIVLTQRWDVPWSAFSPNEELVISHVTQTRCKQLGESPFCHGRSKTPRCPYSPLPTSQKSLTRCSWGPSLHPSNTHSLSLSHPPSSFCSPAPLSFSIPTEERGLLCPDKEGKKIPSADFISEREKECTWWQAFYVANSYLFCFWRLQTTRTKTCFCLQ